MIGIRYSKCVVLIVDSSRAALYLARQRAIRIEFGERVVNRADPVTEQIVIAGEDAERYGVKCPPVEMVVPPKVTVLGSDREMEAGGPVQPDVDLLALSGAVDRNERPYHRM
jgi:hypothetical protein